MKTLKRLRNKVMLKFHKLTKKKKMRKGTLILNNSKKRAEAMHKAFPTFKMTLKRISITNLVNLEGF